jgi:alanine dehydrogenase
MGFPFAEPTSFEAPVFRAGPATYYAVNHSPSWHWRSASWELSRVVVTFLETVMGGPAAWEADETIRRCIEIREGVIQNPRFCRSKGGHPRIPTRPSERPGRAHAAAALPARSWMQSGRAL